MIITTTESDSRTVTRIVTLMTVW